MRRASDRAFTHVELVVTVAILGLIAVGVSAAFDAGIQFQTKVLPARADLEAKRAIEERLRDLLARAYVDPSSEEATGVFIAYLSDRASLSGEAGAMPDSLVFSSAGKPPRGAYLAAADDFETLNEKFGPQGGIAETSLSLAPIGETEQTDGVFLREQRPIDTDPYQGGYESVLTAEIEALGFEFWDGTAWVVEWDTSTMPEARLPAAIRVSYRFASDPQDELRSMIVRVALSDVTPENPAGIGGSP